MDAKYCVYAVLFFVLAIGVWAFVAPSGTGVRVVIVKPAAAALYREGDHDARDDEALYGMTGVVADGMDADNRYLINMEYDYRVRIHRDDLLIDNAAAETWLFTANHCVIAPWADILPAPDSTAYPPLLVLPRGAKLKAEEEPENPNFRKVTLVDGRTGYVRRPALRELRKWDAAGAKTARARVQADALSYVGTPYRWGGKTPQGVDCSGLASMAYLLNGLVIYRNSQPRAGYPIALLHMNAPAGGHTKQSLAKAKPGDLIYWSGHQAVYIGNGKYVHANATSFDVRVNSLLAGDADYRPDLADPAGIFAWGTAFPDEPEKLIVRSFTARRADEKGLYRFYARLDGYAPTKAILYPEGRGEGKPEVPLLNLRRMLYDDPQSQHPDVPQYRYAKPGTYRPAIVFENETGWRPGGKTISSGVFVMPEAVVVK